MSPRDNVWNHLNRKTMRITSQANGTIQSLQFGSQVYSYPSGDENSGCESSSGQNGRSSKRFLLGSWTDKVKRKREVALEAQRDKKKVHFATLMDICHLKNADLQFSEVSRSCRTPRRHCERRLWSLCSFYWRRPVCITNDGNKSSVCHCTTTRLSDTSKFQSQDVQMYGHVFHDINGPNLGRTLKIQCVLLNEICTDTHSLDYCGKGNSRKFCWNTGWEQVQNWECSFVNREKGDSCLCMWTI